MEVKCLIEECYLYHDSENETINQGARELASLIEYTLELRQTYCKCDVEKYVISIKAERMQTTEFKIISGCSHFFEQVVKATHQAGISFQSH